MASPANTLFRAARPLFRQATLAAPARQAFRQQAFRQNFYQGSGRRWQSTDGAQQQQQHSWFKRMWESEIGFKTVHFWAPVMKWALVLAGISDFARPVENLSFTQNLALTCTGIIWTRWCLIIKPKNYLLAAVNFFLGLVGLVQITRILTHESAKKKSLEGVVADLKADAKETVNEVKP
ncbi:related to FMP43 Found in Mitochondrial Proteome [Fusarium torulosum]|uniref:Mitochondrial pyruvate carrier n=1 Tax=Fusarium torulosum TaxID=33205 RepID=A0AAE8MEH7_9HYPO|nr:related to FMP43 Found in Mitochondrial Proteome [Fusarium torulosum]